MTSSAIGRPGPIARLADKLGIPAPLFFGYVGLLLFMIGDGVESGFIAPFLTENGAGTEIRASYVITLYGVAVMIASWLSGALSDLWGPRRVMIAGFSIWLVFDVLFLAIAVPSGNYTLMLLFYGIRGFGYPMFAYAFLVWVTATAPRERLGTAVGWYYFAFTGGLPTLGALVASFGTPVLGRYGTLWLSVGILALGGLICLLGVRERTGFSRLAPAGQDPLRVLVSSVSIAWQNPSVLYGSIARLINTVPMFGMLVFFPTIFSDAIGFGESRWLLLVSIIFGACIFFNLLVGVVSDRLGWKRTIFWLGTIGGAVTFLLLYFVPLAAGADHYWLAILVGIAYGASLAGFVPLSALVPTLAPDNRGGAMALLNLGAGASAFVGPAIVSLLLAPLGPNGVVIIFAALYLVGAVFVHMIEEPRMQDTERTDKTESADTRITDRAL